MNSSLSRVHPVFDELLDRRPFGDPWLEGLWEMAARTRPGAAERPTSLGTLVIEEAPTDRAARVGKVFDRPVAPPAAFLRWLLEHPGQMVVRDADTFGAKSEEVRAWRRRLFSDQAAEVGAAQAEGLRQLGSRLAQRGRHKWWLFEGFARVDACFITDECVLFVEGKRTDAASSSTLWYPQRNLLWRNVEAARELAAGKRFGVVLAVEDESEGQRALAQAEESRAASFPHLETEEMRDLSRHLLGFVTWREVVTRFELPESCLAGQA